MLQNEFVTEPTDFTCVFSNFGQVCENSTL